VPAKGARSPSAVTRRSSRCSRRLASGCRNWPVSVMTRWMRIVATWTCGSGRSPVRGTDGKQRIVKISYPCARTLDRYIRPRSRHAQSWRPQLWLGVSNRGPMTAQGIYQMIVRQCGVRVYPHRFRHHFSHTWLDRGGAEGDLMELNGWTSPQMLRRYGASARSARARRTYDRIMSDNP